MAKSVIINGVTYPDVPYVTIPLSSGSGNANFYDTDIASGGATAGDMRNGTKAVVNGQEVTGNVAEKDSTDVTVSGKTVSIPAGIYDDPVSKNVADGAVTPAATLGGSVLGDTSSSYPVTATPSATVTPGYVDDDASGSVVTKYIQVETKTVTPTTSSQSISPSSGKLISSISVNAVDVSGTATESDVMAGKTFFSGGSLTRKTGNATVPTVSQNATTKVLTVS